MQQDPDEVRIPKSHAPEEIVETVKMKLSNSENDNVNVGQLLICDSTESLIGSPSLSDEDSTSTSDLEQKNVPGVLQNQSQIALARDAVENERVELIPHMSSFIVQANNNKTYSVQMFPKETCNCPSTTTCWHIIASKISLGSHHSAPSII